MSRSKLLYLGQVQICSRLDHRLRYKVAMSSINTESTTIRQPGVLTRCIGCFPATTRLSTGYIPFAVRESRHWVFSSAICPAGHASGNAFRFRCSGIVLRMLYACASITTADREKERGRERDRERLASIQILLGYVQQNSPKTVSCRIERSPA